MLNNQQCR